ncbi:hypothetical protein EI94DRAFT_1833593 [Lactarius quietus]|nr:hypothetical protein EI94DRAFT_1833593 [Lactarius quietus]
MNSTPTHPPPGLQHPPAPPHLQPGSGPCGLTAHEWHVFLVFVVLREHLARFGIIGSPLRPGSPPTAVLFVYFIAVVVAWVQDEDVSDMWLRVKHRVQVTKMGKYLAATYPVYIDLPTSSHADSSHPVLLSAHGLILPLILSWRHFSPPRAIGQAHDRITPARSHHPTTQ